MSLHLNQYEQIHMVLVLYSTCVFDASRMNANALKMRRHLDSMRAICLLLYNNFIRGEIICSVHFRVLC